MPWNQIDGWTGGKMILRCDCNQDVRLYHSQIVCSVTVEGEFIRDSGVAAALCRLFVVPGIAAVSMLGLEAGVWSDAKGDQLFVRAIINKGVNF